MQTKTRIKQLIKSATMTYEALPTTVLPQVFLKQSHGNWGLTEQEYRLALALATTIEAAQAYLAAQGE